MLKDKTYEMLGWRCGLNDHKQLPVSIPTGDETLCVPEIVVPSLGVFFMKFVFIYISRVYYENLLSAFFSKMCRTQKILTSFCFI